MRLAAVLVRRTDDSVPDWVAELTCCSPFAYAGPARHATLWPGNGKDLTVARYYEKRGVWFR